MAIIIAVIFSACTAAKPPVKIPAGVSKNIEVKYKSWGYRFKSQKVSGSERNAYVSPAKEVFNAAAMVGLSEDYSYMAIINTKTNNLSGFPINDWRNMEKYLKLRNYKHYRPDAYRDRKATKLIMNNKVKLRVTYFKEAIPGLFLWDLEKLKRDTQG